MKKIITLFALLVVMTQLSFAQEYGQYDPKKILTVTTTETGDKYGLDLNYLDQIISDLSVHARSYPPVFDNECDQKRATNDAKLISEMLEVLVNTPQADPELLRRTSTLNSIAHNLDIPNAARRADRDYRRLLKKYPEEPSINFAYGAFLGGANQADRAIPFLEKASEAGYVDAYFSLGMAYLMEQDLDMALESFLTYQKKNPDSSQASQIIEAIRSGNVEFETR